ncbi:MAG: hypothetical protein M3Y13_09515 [Armatimonadota bacterium]|nr:hypothetical protein [Armatimonadota bacterium]
MAVEDFMEPEVGVAVAITAVVASPQVRNVLRRGAVYGLAGLLMAGDAVSSLAQGVQRGVQQAMPPAADESTAEATGSAPEILSVDAPVSAAEDKADAAATGHKRARKTAEAADHE